MCSGIEDDDNCCSKKYIENFCAQGGDSGIENFCNRGEKSGNYM